MVQCRATANALEMHLDHFQQPAAHRHDQDGKMGTAALKCCSPGAVYDGQRPG
jgi:hypothetical protein